MMQEWIPLLSNPSMEQFLEPSTIIWFLGVVLLLAGARYYQLLILAPGFAVGSIFAFRYVSADSPLLQFAAVLIIGAVCSVALLSIERLAVSLAGCFVGVALITQVSPMLNIAEPEPYAYAIAALLGSILFPRLYQDLRPVVTAIAGTVCIAWSVNKTGVLLPIVILSCFGSLFQYFLTAPAGKQSKIS